MNFPVSRKQKKDFDELKAMLTSSSEEEIHIPMDVYLDKLDILEAMVERGAITISQYIGDDFKRIEVINIKAFIEWFESENKHAKKLTSREKKNLLLNSFLSLVVSFMTTLITLKLNGAV